MITLLIAHVGFGLTALTNPLPTHAQTTVPTRSAATTVTVPAKPQTVPQSNPMANGVPCAPLGCSTPSEFVWLRNAGWCLMVDSRTAAINPELVDPTCAVRP